MTRTVVALYDDFTSASEAVNDLVDHGFLRDNVSLMANDVNRQYAPYVETDTGVTETTATGEGAGVGAGIGAVIGGLGGLLVGLGALVIPGIGPVIAAGPLAAALSGLAGAGVGAVAGGVTGGLLGALVDMGIPEESAHYYAEGVRRGGTLVMVRTADNMTNQAVDILNNHNPVDINERVTEWRDTGWTGYNPEAGPYTTTTSTPMHRDMATEHEVVAEDLGTNDFNHFETTMAGSGYTYDQYLPAYRYGYDLATNDRFAGYTTWDQVEPEARRYWNERNPDTWDRFKGAVRHAWEEVKDVVS
jgi:hypothetical protein